MDKLNELSLRKDRLITKSNEDLMSLNNLINESYRVAEVAKNSKNILDNLEKQFEESTGLDGVDVTFLFFATALQCVRQYLVSNEKFRFKDATDGDDLVKKVVPRSYQEILLGPVPYDAFQKQEGFEEINFGLSGTNHRYLALGHDPLLGWIFGTINILTSSLTKNNFRLESYKVRSQKLGESVKIWALVGEAGDASIKDYKCLVASVFRQALHLASDAFTQQGLPLPVINNISPDFSSKLLSEEFRIDVYSVSRSVLLSKLINGIIAIIHSLYYDEKKYPNRNIYEVKTRKVISYSNLMATSSNVVYCAITKNFTKLDLGGAVVTINRLINDSNFINEVKEEFVFGEFSKLIKGENIYDGRR